MKKTYQGVLFDLDGTLLNTINLYGYLVNQLLEEYRFPGHTLDDYKSFIGSGTRNLIKRSLPAEKQTEDHIAPMVERFKELYEKHYTEKCKAYKGIRETLISLKPSGVRLGVLTNKVHYLAVACVKHYFPEVRFDMVIGQSKEYRKPEPSGAIALAGKFGLPMADIVMIGDTEVDIQTAKNAGMDSIAVSWGFRKKEALQAENPTYMIDTCKELQSILLAVTSCS